MSVKIMSQVWDKSKHEGGTLLVLLAMADFARDDGICWPSLKTLAEKSRLSERQVIRVLDKLKSTGEIKVEKEANGRGKTAVYRLICDVPQKGDILTKGDICDTKRVTSVTSPIIREPSIEPPVSASPPELSFVEQFKKSAERKPRPNLNKPEFHAAWDQFCTYRTKTKKKTLTDEAKEIILDELESYGAEQAIYFLKQAIASGWPKPFPKPLNGNFKPQPSRPSTSIQIEATAFLAWQKTTFPDRTFYETPETAPLNMIEQFQEENK